MPRITYEEKALQKEKLLLSSATVDFGAEFLAYSNETSTSTTFNEPLSYNNNEETEGNYDSDNDSEEEEESKHSDSEEECEPEPKRRKAAWSDEDDEKEIVQKVNTDVSVSGSKLQEILHERYTKVHGETPGWADLDAKKDEVDETDEDAIVISGPVMTNESSSLQPHHLKYKFVSNLTKYTNKLNGGAYRHKISFANTYPLALCTRNNNWYGKKSIGYASIHQVGADDCHELECLVFQRFPISASTFLPNNKKFIIGASRSKFMYLYDLEASKETQIPWEREYPRIVKNLTVVNENLVMVNESHSACLLDTRSWRAVGTLRSADGVAAVTVTGDESTIYTHGDGGRVYVWDVRSHQSRANFTDDGCITGTAISVSPDGRLLACGSTKGMVNVYNTRDIGSELTKPVKVFKQLLTDIDCLQFNHSSEALVFSSSKLQGAIRVAHFPSKTVFSNFPTLHDKMPIVYQSVFSPHSGYLALSVQSNKSTNDVRRVRLQHFGRY